MSEAGARSIIQALSKAGTAYLVGGCVRDKLMGREPKDWDIATNLVPDKVQEVLTKKKFKIIEVGKEFGVVRCIHEGIDYQIATFRGDGHYSDGRRPDSVEFVQDLRDDASRRDFTINSMYMNPVSGDVIDYFGGKKDLANKLIKTVGYADDRFKEDYLRILRAVRFATRFDFKLHDSVVDGIREYAQNLTKISKERITEELREIVTSPNRLAGFYMLADFGIAELLFPKTHGSYIPNGIPVQACNEVGSPWMEFLRTLEQITITGTESFAKSLGFYMMSNKEPETQYLVLSSKELDELNAIVKNSQDLRRLDFRSYEARIRLFESPYLPVFFDIWQAKEKQGSDLTKRLLDATIWHTHQAPLRLGELPIVNGTFLIEICGLKPSREFGTLISLAKQAQFEGVFVNEAGAVQFIESVFWVGIEGDE